MNFEEKYYPFDTLNGTLDPKGDSFYIIGTAHISELGSPEGVLLFRESLDSMIPREWYEHGRLKRSCISHSQMNGNIWKETLIFPDGS